jgi:hypothetical protein
MRVKRMFALSAAVVTYLMPTVPRSDSGEASLGRSSPPSDSVPP